MKFNFFKYISMVCGLACIGASLFSGCEKKEDYSPTSFSFPAEVLKAFPAKLNIPANNPMTYEGIELGRYLFYDGRLSGRTEADSLMSCGTCHIQETGFKCGINHPKYTGGHPYGLTGIKTANVVMPLVNLVWNESAYTWNGQVSAQNPKAQNMEDIVWMTVLAKDEIAGDTTQTKKLIQSIKGYPELFERAFGSPEVTFKRISMAIAQFVRTLVSANSKFDQYVTGQTQLTEDELRGFELFMTESGADCFHCHGGDGNLLFTTNLFYNNGKDAVFGDENDRYAVTGSPSDIGAYKAPTLRNIEFTAPYMHDGRFKTLEEVVDFYSTGVKNTPYTHSLMHHSSQGGVRLLEKDKKALIAFLKTLNDPGFLTNPAYAKPASFPDGSVQK